MTPLRRLLTTAFLFAALASPAARAQQSDKATLCLACHGKQGVPVNPAIPVIAGQNEGYLYLELRDYKLGNRKNVTMTAVAAGLSKPDMLALAALFAGQQWPALNQKAPSPDQAKRAETAINAAVCQSCHLANWQGASTTPRVGGQRAGYLRATMAAFRDGSRANNPWMSALLKTYSDADIAALAAYLAGH